MLLVSSSFILFMSFSFLCKINSFLNMNFKQKNLFDRRMMEAMLKHWEFAIGERTTRPGQAFQDWFYVVDFWVIDYDSLQFKSFCIEQDWILKSRKYRRSRCVATDSLNDQWFQSRSKRDFSRTNSSWSQVKPSWILESFIFITWRNQPWYKSAEENWTSCITNTFHG